VRWQLEERRGAARGVSAAGLAVIDIAISARTDPRPGLHGTALVVSVALSALVVGVLGSVLSLEGPARRLTPFAAVLTAAAMTLLWVQQRGNAGLAGIGTVLVIAAARLFRRPRVLAAITVVLFAIVAVEMHRRVPLTQSLVLCLPIAAVCMLMAMFQRLRDAKCRAQALLAELEQNRDAQARAAALAERQHLAREMHDVLAHSLSGLMLQLEGARMLARTAPDDPRLPDVVNRAHELAKDGLAEARHAIGMLRGEQLPGPDAIGTLTGQFERHSGIPCAFAAAGQARTVPPDARLAVYRVTQEALTNVVKHAHAERVEVCLTYAPEEVRLSVEDFGERLAAVALPEACEAPASLTSVFASGYGLTGMRERAELLGGTLTAAATGGGFRVELRVPA
jgi:signal transduction histidine kinase